MPLIQSVEAQNFKVEKHTDAILCDLGSGKDFCDERKFRGCGCKVDRARRMRF